MTPAQLLAQLGPQLFGAQWKSAMERALKIREGRIDDWSKGRGVPPPGVWLELAALVQDRRELLQRLHIPVLEMAGRPAPRIYQGELNGLEFVVEPYDDGTYPTVHLQDGTGFWEPLSDLERMIPADAIAFQLRRGDIPGEVTPAMPGARVSYPPEMRTTNAIGTFAVSTERRRR